MAAPAALLLLFCARAEAAGQGSAQAPPRGAGARCAADFDAIETKVKADYAGFRDKVEGRARQRRRLD